MYQISDANLTITADTFADAVVEIAEWYADYPEWATGHASQKELDMVASAIDSVDPPVDGDASDLQAYADDICHAIAMAYEVPDWYGHGRYAVSAADQMGLSLTIEEVETSEC